MNVRRERISSLWSLPSRQDASSMSRDKDVRLWFDTLYQQYYTRVLAYLRFRVGVGDVAEDLTSVVFERALMHLTELQNPEVAGAWLFRIARNCAADYFRQRQAEVSLDAMSFADHPVMASLEEYVLADEQRKLLLVSVNRLAEREREIIGLKFVAHLSNREIARILHMPEGTVGSVLYRTLRQLRANLHKEGGDDE